MAVLSILWIRQVGGYCSVSARYNTQEDQRYRYPVEMFPEGYILPFLDKGKGYYTCTSHNFRTNDNIISKCIEEKLSCPITEVNLETAVRSVDWAQYAQAFQLLYKTLNDPSILKNQKVNVIFLGGSMTYGSRTFGACRCNQKADSRCTISKAEPRESECTWATLLSDWMRKQFPAVKFNFFSFAKTGFDSRVMAEIFSDHMRLFAPGHHLTANDIVFVDHSVNDFRHGRVTIQHSFELLIQRILKFGEPAASTATGNSTALYARPTIVVIDQYAKPKITTADGRPESSAVYRAVSRHYGLMYLSLREVFWSYHQFTNITLPAPPVTSTAQGNLGKTVSVRQYAHNPAESLLHLDAHPPWFVHLYIADLVADSLMQTMKRISTQIADASGGSAFLVDLSNQPKVSVASLPPSLLSADQLNGTVCDRDLPFPVDAHSNSTFQPSKVEDFERDISTAKCAGWREYVDYHGVPGWMINALSDPTQRVLTFPFQHSTAVSTTDLQRLLLRIRYLKSYTGMGAVKVSICGAPMYCDPATGLDCTIDGLYHDYETNRVSLPEVFLYELQEEDATRCAQLPSAERTVQLEYFVDRHKDARGLLAARKHQKFKLISLTVCSKTKD